MKFGAKKAMPLVLAEGSMENPETNFNELLYLTTPPLSPFATYILPSLSIVKSSPEAASPVVIKLPFVSYLHKCPSAIK